MKNQGSLLTLIRSFAMMIVLSLLLAGCELNNEYKFPVISYVNQSSQTTSRPVSEESEISSGTLQVALPLTEECVKYLIYMYVGERAGLFRNTGVSSSGLSISTELLDSYDVGLYADLVQTGDYGLSTDEISMLSASNTLPDIFLSRSFGTIFADNSKMATLNGSYLDSYINPGYIYPTMFYDDTSTESVFAIPFYSSVKMVFANYNLILEADSAAANSLKAPLSMQQIRNVAKVVTNANTGIYGVQGLDLFMAYLPSCINPFPSAYSFDFGKYTFEENSFTRGIDLLNDIAIDKTAVDFLTDAAKTELYGDIDPRSMNSIAFWIDDSSSLAYWNSSIDNVTRYPLPLVDRVSVPLTIYSLAVNANSVLLEEARDLAVYIALDKDALLFRSRYVVNNGFIPPVNDIDVWNNLVATQNQGSELIIFMDNMMNSHSLPEEQRVNIEDVYSIVYEQNIERIIKNNETVKGKIDAIETSANELFGGLS